MPGSKQDIHFQGPGIDDIQIRHEWHFDDVNQKETSGTNAQELVFGHFMNQ